jgi:DNA-binding transcriptional regulator YhcF (GntR family)
VILLGVDQVAAVSTVPVPTLYRWAAVWDQRPTGPMPLRLGPRQLRYRVEDVAAWLVMEITSGRRKPGEPLPSVRDLAAEHGQTVAQRALMELVREGWATLIPGSGTYVADPLRTVKLSLEERLAQVEADVAEIKSRLDLW